MIAAERMAGRAAILGTQPADEKFPVNFLLFTESTVFALLKVVLSMAPPLGYWIGSITMVPRQ
jgi:hypothetical protein